MYNVKSIQVPVSFCGLLTGINLNNISEDFKRTHLAHQFNIKVSNPFIRLPRPAEILYGALPATGDEPRYIGNGLSSEEIVCDIAEKGAECLRRSFFDEPGSQSIAVNVYQLERQKKWQRLNM